MAISFSRTLPTVFQFNSLTHFINHKHLWLPIILKQVGEGGVSYGIKHYLLDIKRGLIWDNPFKEYHHWALTATIVWTWLSLSCCRLLESTKLLWKSPWSASIVTWIYFQLFFPRPTMIQNVHFESFSSLSNCSSNVPKTNKAKSWTSHLWWGYWARNILVK